MGLQVWLPLNGSLNNHGLTNVSPVNNGATVNANGKIGSCYQFNGSSHYIDTGYGKGISNKEISLTLWVKPLASLADKMIIGCSNGSNQRLYIGVKNNTYNLSFGSQTWGRTTSAPVTTNKWDFLAIVVKDYKATLYFNGVEVESFTQPAFNLASNIYVGGRTDGYYSNALINDVRIYDHALSMKELKEISKALCLHYTLNNNGGGGDNILLGTNQGISNWSWSMQAGDSTKTEVIMDGVKCCKITRGSTAQSGWSYLFYSHLNYSAYKPSTVYTISMEVYPSVDTSFSFSNFMAGNATAPMLGNVKTIQGSVKANQWNKLIFQGTTLDTLPASGSQGVYFTVSNKNTGVSYIFRNIKVEEGPNATVWIPNKADALYSQAGFGNNIEYDTSGFKNNGTIVGTIPCTSDTPRYSASMTFDGNCANYIKSAAPLNFLTNTLTVSCWIYQTATSSMSSGSSNSNPFIVSFGRDYEHYGFNLRSASGVPTFFIGGGATGNISVSSGVNVLNGWHMVTGVWDGATAKIYIDGVLKASKACTGVDYTHATGSLVVGKMSYGHTSTTSYFPFPGKISDVRVYATALSDADVLQLYNTPISVDNMSSMYALELKEV